MMQDCEQSLGENSKAGSDTNLNLPEETSASSSPSLYKMAPADKKAISKIRHPYKRISIATKLKILEKIDEGIGLTKIAQLMQVPKTTVFNIKKHREKIEKCSNYLPTEVAEKVVRARNPGALITETLLMTWISDQREKGADLSEQSIRPKALAIYESLNPELKMDGKFAASHGWFTTFRDRHNLKNIDLGLPLPAESASAEEQAVSEYNKHILEICKQEGYSDIPAAPPTEYPCADSQDVKKEEIPSLDYAPLIAEEPVVTSAEESNEKKQHLSEFLDLAGALEQKLSFVEENIDERIKFLQVLDGVMYTYKKAYDELN